MRRATIISILIAVLAFIASVAVAQCQFWPITPLSGVPVSVTEPYDPAFQPLCDTCGAQGCANWEINGPFNGSIVIQSPDSTIAHLYITEQCSLVLHDTCMMLRPNPAIPPYVIYVYGSNIQIRVCGIVGGTVQVIVWDVLTPTYYPLTPYLDLSACTPIVGLSQAQPKPRRYAVFDGYTWIIQDKPPALGWYKEIR